MDYGISFQSALNNNKQVRNLSSDTEEAVVRSIAEVLARIA